MYNSNLLNNDTVATEELAQIVDNKDWGAYSKDEKKQIKEMVRKGRDYNSDFDSGETLIRDSYFQEYAKELAEDIGCLPEGHNWPAYCIDWEFAAKELQYDYSHIDTGSGWWIRCT